MSLMKKGNDPGIMRRWREVADTVTDRRLKAELRLVAVYAQLTGHERQWQKNLEGFDVQESVIVKEWQDEAKVQILVENLSTILREKFGAVPDEVVAKIEGTTDLTVLRHWNLVAAKVDSLDKFRQGANL